MAGIIPLGFDVIFESEKVIGDIVMGITVARVVIEYGKGGLNAYFDGSFFFISYILYLSIDSSISGGRYIMIVLLLDSVTVTT